jgi:dihydrodipicolinate synthase/N-acetylneuraminate lyase
VLGLANGGGTGVEELADDPLDGGVEVICHLVDEADPQRRLGAEAFAGEEVAPRGSGADPGQHERGDHRRNDPQLDLREAEGRVRRRDRDVRARCQPAAAAEAIALNPGNDGDGGGVDRLEHAEEPKRVLDVLLVGEVDRGALPLHVRACAEALALPGEHHGARITDVGEGVSERSDQRSVEGVPPFRPGDRHAKNLHLPFDSEHAHERELKVRSMLVGALAAAVTPLRDGGSALDEEAFESYVDFLVAGGLDGLLALGTTGEGILLSPGERQRAAELFVATARGRIQVAIHCGAQTTSTTVELARHAGEAGADAVAVIAPPYFQLDEAALLAHFEAAAHAAAPVPFYVYEFERASGYSVPPGLVERLRESAPNLAGLKVSDRPFDRVAPYLIEGLDVFIGAESLIAQGLDAGAAGAVSGLAAAFPEPVAAVVRAPSAERANRLGELRRRFDRVPRHAALKFILGRRGVPVQEDVRAPLRGLTGEERTQLETWLESSSPVQVQ